MYVAFVVVVVKGPTLDFTGFQYWETRFVDRDPEKYYLQGAYYSNCSTGTVFEQKGKVTTLLGYF
jgi:hypothetical protein